MSRTTRQNSRYHLLSSRLHRLDQVRVWDGRFGQLNPITFNPKSFASYDDFREWMAKLDLDYPRDEEGKPVSSAKLSVDEMVSHSTFLEVLLTEVDDGN